MKEQMWGETKRRNRPLGPPKSLKDHEGDVKEKGEREEEVPIQRKGNHRTTRLDG
jgi:hypothetical protein